MDAWGYTPRHTQHHGSSQKRSDFAILWHVCFLLPHCLSILFSSTPRSLPPIFFLSLSQTLWKCVLYASQAANPLTSRLIGKCSVFLRFHSSSRRLVAATCSSIILLLCPAFWISPCSDNLSLYIYIYYIQTHMLAHPHALPHMQTHTRSCCIYNILYNTFLTFLELPSCPILAPAQHLVSNFYPSSPFSWCCTALPDSFPLMHRSLTYLTCKLSLYLCHAQEVLSISLNTVMHIERRRRVTEKRQK